MAPARPSTVKATLQPTEIPLIISLTASLLLLVLLSLGAFFLSRIYSHRSQANTESTAPPELPLPSSPSQSTKRWGVAAFSRSSIPSLHRCSALLKAMSLSSVELRATRAQNTAEQLDMDFACRGLTQSGSIEALQDVGPKPSPSLAESLSLRYLAVMEKAARRKEADALATMPEEHTTLWSASRSEDSDTASTHSVPTIMVSLPSRDHIVRDRPTSSALDGSFLTPRYSPPPAYSALPLASDAVVNAGTQARRARPRSNAMVSAFRPPTFLVHTLRPRPQLGLFAPPTTVTPGTPGRRLDLENLL
ncbi:hypothetical protein FA95DRAFT_1604612 [Auriscalpium vulgare]|uniref:Uncharacterized protein n=1 Tax=Auriscalpium vulgare TaxID=40419 RepID=A0ACB8S034_9AGAM|nr:hypothetical protein FA95DRAFT_1604612 [Auriscalpium vulgare]